MSDTVETWKKRVASWRASGQTAEEFSKGRPWSLSTLRWWSSRLRRDASAPVLRVAQLVRSGELLPRERGGSIIVEVLDARLRITIEVGAERDTVAAVLNVLVPETR